jgi:hypothetical protein
MQTLQKLAACLAAGALVLLCSCEPLFSIHPYYTDKDITFDSRLLGTWFDPEEASPQSTIEFRRVNDKGRDAYSITLVDSSKNPVESESFVAHLVKLDGHLFLDTVQTKISVGDHTLDTFALPVHMLGRVSFDDEVLNLAFLDDDWVKKNLENGTISIRHDTTDDGTPVLTAATQDLQKFALDHVNDDQAFSLDVKNLHRKK